MFLGVHTYVFIVNTYSLPCVPLLCLSICEGCIAVVNITSLLGYVIVVRVTWAISIFMVIRVIVIPWFDKRSLFVIQLCASFSPV